MSNEIPFDKLGIPASIQSKLQPDSPKKIKLALAKGLLPTTAAVQLAVCYGLATVDQSSIAEAAKKTIQELPSSQILAGLTQQTHPKIIEFLIEFRPPDPEVDERVAMMRIANERTVRLIARRCNEALCDLLARNHERLLLVPDLFMDLRDNPTCKPLTLQHAEAFLRMQNALPEAAEEKSSPEAKEASSTDNAAGQVSEMDLMAEIEAAIRGDQSPALLEAQTSNLQMFDVDGLDDMGDGLGDFQFNFSDDAEDFGWDLTGDLSSGDGEKQKTEKVPIEKKIADMTVGQKIKLAYLGNVSSRKILIRDNNSLVAAAVVKSGRCSEGEVKDFAGNRNLHNDVLREIAMNKEYTRKYPVKVALTNNPKTSIPVAMSFINSLQKQDLLSLTRNKNVPGVITQTALRLYKSKFQKE